MLLKTAERGGVAVPFGEKVGKVELVSTFGLSRWRISRPGADRRLRSWRLGQARAQGVPAFVVFNDRTLEALAALRPGTEQGLLHVPGIGPAKLEAYGDQLLDLLGSE